MSYPEIWGDVGREYSDLARLWLDSFPSRAGTLGKLETIAMESQLLGFLWCTSEVGFRCSGKRIFRSQLGSGELLLLAGAFIIEGFQ
ncbi:hypothetical protein [Bremerella volcania]|uniref:hypothetical protein n=1 Tax=Bremerella volcania TaxID=2527984 RepID=UPI0011A9EDE7|nr:hypothetical protein [Bremerella volcania]